MQNKEKEKKFREEVLEKTKLSKNSVYPYHLKSELIMTNKINPLKRYCHTFDEVLEVMKIEPFAFYITNEDKIFYSSQEIEDIEDFKKVILTNNVDMDTINNIEFYLKDINLTLEEVVLLKKYSDLKQMTIRDSVFEILRQSIKNLSV